jgi:hypothetical protein
MAHTNILTQLGHRTGVLRHSPSNLGYSLPGVVSRPLHLTIRGENTSDSDERLENFCNVIRLLCYSPRPR